MGICRLLLLLFLIMDKNCSPSINTYPYLISIIIPISAILPVMDFKIPVKGEISPVTCRKLPVKSRSTLILPQRVSLTLYPSGYNLITS